MNLTVKGDLPHPNFRTEKGVAAEDSFNPAFSSVLAIAAVGVVWILLGEWGTWEEVWAAGLVVITIGYATATAFRHGRLNLSLGDPLTLINLFFVLYYPLPLALQIALGELEPSMAVTIGALQLTALTCWHFGLRLVLPRATPLAVSSMTRNQARGLLALCLVGVCLVVYSFVLRSQNDIFFNQARYYESEPTIAGSFALFAASFQLITILFLGVVFQGTKGRLAQFARRAMIAYGIFIFFALVLSSQTRPAVTAATFLGIGLAAKYGGVPRLRHVALGFAAALFAVVTVQAVRVVIAEDFASADNQVLYAVTNTWRALYTGLASKSSVIGERVISRGGGGAAFLSEVITEVNSRGAPFWGEGVMHATYGLVPRILWPDKPGLDAAQIVAQELMGYEIPSDAGFGPITQFYFEGGWFGVIVGFVLLGAIVGWVTRFAANHGTVGAWIVLCSIWVQLVQLESEQIIGLLGALRNAAVIYLMWRGLIWLSNVMAPESSAARPMH